MQDIARQWSSACGNSPGPRGPCLHESRLWQAHVEWSAAGILWQGLSNSWSHDSRESHDYTWRKSKCKRWIKSCVHVSWLWKAHMEWPASGVLRQSMPFSQRQASTTLYGRLWKTNVEWTSERVLQQSLQSGRAKPRRGRTSQQRGPSRANMPDSWLRQAYLEWTAQQLLWKGVCGRGTTSLFDSRLWQANLERQSERILREGLPRSRWSPSSGETTAQTFSAAVADTRPCSARTSIQQSSHQAEKKVMHAGEATSPCVLSIPRVCASAGLAFFKIFYNTRYGAMQLETEAETSRIHLHSPDLPC